MDADIPNMPEKPVPISRSSEEIEKKFELLLAPRKPGLVISYGPISAINLGLGWDDLGVVYAGGRPVRRAYENKDLRCAVSINFRADNHNSDSDFLQKLTQKLGPVPKSEWDKIIVFGMSGNPRFFTIESVEVSEFGGKNVIVLSGQNTEGSQSRAKHVYVSLSDDWKNSYDIAFGAPSDKTAFEKAVAVFDKALETVVWRKPR